MKSNHKQMCRLRASKKGVSMPMQTIVYFVILGVFLLLVTQSVFNPESGLLWRAGNAVSEIVSMVPNTQKQIELKPIPLDPDVRKSMNSILHALIAAKDANAPCILEYKKEDLKGYIVTFLNNNGNTHMYVITPDMQIVKPEEAKYSDYVPGVTVCVVAGKRTPPAYNPPFREEFFQQWLQKSAGVSDVVAQNFYNNWIDCETGKAPCKQYRLFEYNDVEKIKISYERDIMFKYNTLFADLPDGTKLGEDKNNLEDGGLLYVPEKGKVCFLATVNIITKTGCSGSYLNGVDNGCFDDADEVGSLLSALKCKN